MELNQPTAPIGRAAAGEVLQLTGMLTALATACTDVHESGDYMHAIVPKDFKLQDISEAEALAEGIQDGGCNNCGESSHPNPCGCANPEPLYVDAFAWLWNSINGKRAPWVLNPWVWVVTFKPL